MQGVALMLDKASRRIHPSVCAASLDVGGAATDRVVVKAKAIQLAPAAGAPTSVTGGEPGDLRFNAAARRFEGCVEAGKEFQPIGGGELTSDDQVSGQVLLKNDALYLEAPVDSGLNRFVAPLTGPLGLDVTGGDLRVKGRLLVGTSSSFSEVDTEAVRIFRATPGLVVGGTDVWTADVALPWPAGVNCDVAVELESGNVQPADDALYTTARNCTVTLEVTRGVDVLASESRMAWCAGLPVLLPAVAAYLIDVTGGGTPLTVHVSLAPATTFAWSGNAPPRLIVTATRRSLLKPAS
jgi:hypothetical protein